MRASPAALALAALVVALAAAPAIPQEEDLPPLKVNPFAKGLDGWERSGPDKAFAWNAEESTLTVKGQSAKEPPRLVYAKIQWDGGALRFQAKKGTRKIRVVLQPVPKAPPLVLEFPKDAVKPAAWTDLAVALRGGKAVLLAPGADGSEAEVASAPLAAGTVCRFGFEAPSGTDAVLTGIGLQRDYEDVPPFAEEGFESVFDGKSLGAWQPFQPDHASMFSVEKGLIAGVVRSDGGGGLTYAGRFYRAYELRMRAYWGTTHLLVRAVEFPGADGKLNKFDTILVNLGDYIDPGNVNDLSVRVADGLCVMTVNGKKVFESKVKPFETTPITFFLNQGKKFLLRDIRIKDLAPGEGVDPGGGRREPERPAAEEKTAVPWTPKGGFAEEGGVWTVSDPSEIAGLLCQAANAGSYELRFKVAKGAEGLSVIPRANRGVERAAGIRLGEAFFLEAEWTEVVLRMDLVKATVTAGGAAAGSLEVDSAAGPPGIRVAIAGKARIKDIVIVPLKK
jgi:hypothetical protein